MKRKKNRRWYYIEQSLGGRLYLVFTLSCKTFVLSDWEAW